MLQVAIPCRGEVGLRPCSVRYL